MELAQQMIPGAPIEVVLTELSTQAFVGHDGIEVVHQIGFRHHREVADVGIGQRVDVHPCESLAMPPRTLAAADSRPRNATVRAS